VWNRAGISGSNDTLRLYVDGAVVARSAVGTWGNTVGSQADICGAMTSRLRRQFLMDNIRIWDYAKTNFAIASGRAGRVHARRSELRRRGGFRRHQPVRTGRDVSQSVRRPVPDCDWMLADCNGDGYVDFDDINRSWTAWLPAVARRRPRNSHAASG